MGWDDRKGTLKKKKTKKKKKKKTSEQSDNAHRNSEMYQQTLRGLNIRLFSAILYKETTFVAISAHQALLKRGLL